MNKSNSRIIASTLLVSAFFASNSFAAALDVSGDMTISGEQEYSNTGSYGISGGGNVTFDSSITVKDSEEGILVNSGSSITINNTGDETILDITAGTGIKNDGALSINDMGVNINVPSSSADTAIGIDNSNSSSMLSIADSIGGKDIRISFENSTSTENYIGINSTNGGSLAISNMDIYVHENSLNNSSALNLTAISLNGTINGNGSQSIIINNNTLSSTAAGGGSSGFIGIDVNAASEINSMNVFIGSNTSNQDKSIGMNVGADMTILGASDDYNIFNSSGNSANNDNGSTAAGIFVESGSNLTMTNMNIYLDNNSGVYSGSGGGFGLYNSGGTIVINTDSDNKGNISLKNNSEYGIYNNAGNITIDNMNISVSGNSFYTSRGTSELNLDNSNVVISDNKSAFVFGDDSAYGGPSVGGKINLYNTVISAETGYLAEVMGFSNIEFNAESSTIAGGISVKEGSRSTLNLTSSTWLMRSSSVVSSDAILNVNNTDSVIDLRSSTSGIFNTLTVKNYTGSNGTIKMNAKVGSDGSPSDQLIIAANGTASGSTQLHVINVNGDGQESVDGIKLVSAGSGVTIGSDVFTLKGRVVDSGAYEYELFQGDTQGVDTQSFYLRSTNNLTNIARTIANEPSLLLSFSKTGMSSVMQRLSELRYEPWYNNSGLWVRTYAKELEVEDFIKTSVNIYGVEAGYDYKYNLSKYYIVYFGIMGGYMYGNDIYTKQDNGDKNGDGDASMPSAGVYATVSTYNGWFVDLVARNFWEDMELKSYTAAGDMIKYTSKRMISAASVELGKKNMFYTGRSRTSGFIVEPSAQVMYAYSAKDSSTTSTGRQIYFGDTQSITGKASLMLGYSASIGKFSAVEPYVKGSVIHEFDGKTDVGYGATIYNSDISGTSYEVGGGLNLKIGANSQLFLDAMYETGDNIESLSGNLGFRVNW
ncbi:MAG: autotransporter outer membrane beta-barrel domain-containing protein [Lactobacillaceae bacterium]|jgi:outer membrane autotransporter protein|nr:autotransporter outer membrane beta-barrel domain-containing protein [Lactobacillaceae bacterium]